MPLFWLFLAVPLIEIALFITVGGAIGLWPTLALVLVSAVVGTALMRSQGARAWAELQTSMATLQDPTRPIAHGAMILFAGALLLTPGFFTDAVGLALLVPGVRDWLMRRAGRHVVVTRAGAGLGAGMGGGMGAGFGPQPHRRAPHRPPYDDGVIDADYTVEDDAPQPPRHGPPSGWTRH